MIVTLTLACSYDLPDDEAERQTLYGTTDPRECAKVDLDVDPFGFFECCEDIFIAAAEVFNA